MATIEQLNALMDGRRRMPPQPESVSLDLSEVVQVLADIAGSLSREAEAPIPIDHRQQIRSAAQAIASAIEPLAAALRSIDIPPPVVNVAPAPVTIERAHFPRIADVQRDEHGLLKRIVFSDGDDDDEPDELEID